MNFSKLVSALPPDLKIVLADVGSAGGLHKRWKPIRRHVSALLFDPLEETSLNEAGQSFPFALAEKSGTASLFVLKRVSMTSMLQPNFERLRWFKDKPDHVQIVDTLHVPTRPLDKIVAEAGIAVDVIKIDVQGGEWAVLGGAAQCLSSSILFAEIEVSFFDRYEGLAPFDKVMAFMRQHGFDLVDLSRLKRYRYRNRAGIAVEGSSGKSPLGKLAFCDATFMLRETILLERIRAAANAEGSGTLLKAIAICLAYGKADIAAWLFDECGDLLNNRQRQALSAGFTALNTRYKVRNLPKVAWRRLRGIS